MIKVLLKRIICGILVHVIVNKACKIDEYVDIKNCSCEKRLINKLVSEYKVEILNTTETLLEKKRGCAENNCLIHTISLVIICLLLLALICVTCYFCYKKYRLKQKHYHINIYINII